MSQLDGHNAELQAKQLGACLRDAATQSASVEHMAAEAERLRRAVHQTANSKRSYSSVAPRLAWLLAAAALVGVLIVGVWTKQRLRLDPLVFEVIGPGRVSSSYVSTPEKESALLQFSDGSTVLAHQATRLRIPELRADGATVMLERGRATLQVQHRNAKTRWNVVAGPFVISVTGTRFDVEWVPATERLSVDLLEGSVEVVGPRFTEPATLRGGQRIEANSYDAAWAVTPLLDARTRDPNSKALADGALVTRDPGSELVGVIPSALPAAPSAPTHERHPAKASSTTAPAPASSTDTSSLRNEAPSWSKLVGAGEAHRVVSEAESMGITTCLGQCSSSDLRALADAARYSGRLDLAEASLRALRERFPAHAAVAAYLLGTVDEARGRNASALRWYEEYIAAAPNGGFASEAFAGRLRMLVATNGHTSARKAAQQYLELYPNGVGVRTAKQVLNRQ